MKGIFKKAVAFVLLLTMLCSISACAPGDPVADGVVMPSELAAFTIVYPADYTDSELDEIRLLQNVIHHITGSYVPVVPDTETPATNEIILASANRTTGVSETVKAFTSELDYVIALDGNNIVLGGKGYYGNMRAIYDFINNYLGYDDLNDTYADPTAQIKDTKTAIYTEPALTISVQHEGARPFSSAKDVKVMADAGFNMVRLDTSRFEPELYYDYTKWCARFGVRVLQRSVYSIKNRDFYVNDLEYSINNPIIFGHWAKYEASIDDIATYNDMCAAYAEKYEQYGWKLVMTAPAQKDNYLEQYISAEEGRDPITYEKDENGDWVLDEEGNRIPLPPVENTREKNIFNGAAILNADIGFGKGAPSESRDETRVNEFNKFMQLAKRNNRELWATISAGDIIGKATNAYKWQSYLVLAYGVTGIEYTAYRGVLVNNDFTVTDEYEIIQKVNLELLALAETYRKYELVGMTIVNPVFDDSFSVLDAADNSILEHIQFTPISTEKPYLLSCFKEKDGEKYAAVIVDLSEVETGTSVSPASGVKIGDSAVSYYRDGVLTDAKLSAATGAYSVYVMNGSGAFAFVKE